ncbi:hypothetical protein [Methyloglobulus sp.]|uniref:hypothetical protein n=1 Tax=Methyloglobulus sp. TaxID=2518622 RepID=UPI003989403D
MDENTLDKIAEFICGNGEQYPVYRSSSQLTAFFSRAGLARNVHDGSTRQRWVLNCLKQCNREELASVLKRLASPKEYGGDREQTNKALQLLNDMLYIEGFQIRLSGIQPQFEKINIDYSVISKEELKPLPPPDFLSLGLEPGIGEILKHRWDEAQRCVDSKAFLAATIVMGSLLEGLLLAVCQKKPAEVNTCSCAPKDSSSGKVKHFADWKLSEMIDVAHEVGWLGLDVKKFSHSLREFRNMIHPYQHMLMRSTPDEDTCNISWLVVQASINDLARSLKSG